ncbi:MAG: hypothetical protein ACRD1Y_13590, partial [Terriglobales bacterium]
SEHLWPIWSRDGRWVYFSSNAGSGAYNIFRKRADGSGDEQRVSNSAMTQQPSSISPNGSTLLYTALGVTDSNAEWLLPLAPPGKPCAILKQETGLGVGPRISPDGRWQTYYADGGNGEFEVFVMPFPDSHGSRWQVSTGGGYWPDWSPDGHTLYYYSGDMVMATAVGADASGAFSFQPPHALFALHSPEYPGDTGAPFTPLPDGSFLVDALTGDSSGSAAPPIAVTTGWTQSLMH